MAMIVVDMFKGKSITEHRVEGIKEVYVLLLSRIGTPVDRPQLATAQLLLEKGQRIDEIAAKVEEIFEHELADISGFCEALAHGDYPVC